MNILVTGAAGFLGAKITRRLLADGHDVAGVDIMHPQDWWRLLAHKRLTYTWTHLEDITLKRGYDAVVHCAASSNVGFVQNSPKYAMHQTVLGTLQLLRQCVEQSVSKVFINISSHSVYGAPQYTPVDEVHPRVPNNVYGALKVAQEALVDSFREHYGLNTITLRMATMFGEQDRRGSTVYEILLKIMRGETITITGDGEQTRDFNYVGNACDAIVLALTAQPNGYVYNVGSGRALSINDLVHTLARETGPSVPIIKYVPARPGEEKMKDFSLVIDEARMSLGYAPIVDFEEGVRRLYQWVRDQLSHTSSPLSRMSEELLPTSSASQSSDLASHT